MAGQIPSCACWIQFLLFTPLRLTEENFCIVLEVRISFFHAIIIKAGPGQHLYLPEEFGYQYQDFCKNWTEPKHPYLPNRGPNQVLLSTGYFAHSNNSPFTSDIHHLHFLLSMGIKPSMYTTSYFLQQ